MLKKPKVKQYKDFLKEKLLDVPNEGINKESYYKQAEKNIKRINLQKNFV